MILEREDCRCSLEDTGGLSVLDSWICPGFSIFMLYLEAYLKGRCNIATPCNNPRTVRGALKSDDSYDFIVVGAGAAGSVVASRLGELKDYRTILLEAGPEEPIGARVPSFYRAFWGNENIDWNYRTVPENYCLDQNGKGCQWPRGKVVGGSNVLNGMMYHKGHEADYEDWVKAGAKGWSWKEVQPYFDMSENNKQLDLVNPKYHSDKGVMPIQQFSYQPQFAFDLLDGVNSTGLPVITDMNDPNTPDGFVVAQCMTNNGQRYTSARAYLDADRASDRVHLKTKAMVTKVLIDGNRQATGVEYIDLDSGETKTLRATKEVILSAGALNSPKILMHSGIGPKPILDKLNIPVVEDLPVGNNLRNHLGITLYFTAKKLENMRVLDWTAATDFLMDRKGPMSSTGITQVTGLLYSSLADQSRKQPDLQFFFNGMYAECSYNGTINETVGQGDCYLRGTNISANGVALLPRSRGYMTLNSSDPRDSPLFYPGYFSHPDDMTMIIDAAHYLRRIFDSDIMKNKYGIELDPKYTRDCDKSGDAWSDSWIECMARLHTDPQNHQVGTAAMDGTVTSPETLKVRNIKGLRVIDAAVIPTLMTGNPQGSIMMVAERGAEFIKNDLNSP